MSIATTGLSDRDIIYKKPLHHHRKESGEIDVFEASMYFSGYNETYNMRVERGSWRTQRMSLDIPVRDIFPSESYQMQKVKKEKKHKQPNSPAGKLASFLNSLLKKKKSKSMKDEEESHGGKKWRRSSISHFGSTTPANSRSMIYPSLNSGFRTPPPYTPMKEYKDSVSYSVHKQVSPFSKYNGYEKPIIPKNDVYEKFRLNHNVVTQGYKVMKVGNKCLEKDQLRAEKYAPENKETMQLDDVDDGAESDSSADLFELQNYDLGYYPSGLPVYETTKLDSLKKGDTVSK